MFFFSAWRDKNAGLRKITQVNNVTMRILVLLAIFCQNIKDLNLQSETEVSEDLLVEIIKDIFNQLILFSLHSMRNILS